MSSVKVIGDVVTYTEYANRIIIQSSDGEMERSQEQFTKLPRKKLPKAERSASSFQCTLCPEKFEDRESFGDHVKNIHNAKWYEYMDKYGSCETEYNPF